MKQSETMRIAVGASKRQLIVDLEELRDTQSLPAIDHALHDVNIALAGKGSQRHGIAENINEMNSVKSFFALEVAGANQGGQNTHGPVNDVLQQIGQQTVNDFAVNDVLLLVK
jgi:hypothetical protein